MERIAKMLARLSLRFARWIGAEDAFMAGLEKHAAKYGATKYEPLRWMETR